MSSGSEIHRYLLGGLANTEVLELDRRLAEDAALRREFVLAAAMDAALRETAMRQAVEPPAAPPAGVPKRAIGAGLMAIAASLIVAAAWGLPWRLDADLVGMIASSENAAWESSLPTMPGLELGPGLLSLKSGVATIRFHSGAEVLLEAPAKLELVTPMRGKLLSGAAMIEVPESATGFILETPDGYAIDYGTRFAVQVDEQAKRSDFELIEGEVGIHHRRSGDSVRLLGPERAATLSEQSLRLGEVGKRAGVDGIQAAPVPIVRIGTHGRAGSAIRNNKREKFIDREVLTVKTTDDNDWDHRSFFAFDLSAVDMDRVGSARLRLNLVPSTRGSTLQWPKISRFAVYGVTDPGKADWKANSVWKQSPGPEDGIRLGTFQIPRSEQRGAFGIQGQRLVEFLKANADRPVTLVLVRLSTQLEGKGPVSPHMFASDHHPESVGPLLEFILTE